MRQWTGSALVQVINSLSPVRRQAITWTNAGLLSIGVLGTNFSEIWISILSFPFKKMHLKLSSAKMAAILSRGDGSAFIKLDQLNPWIKDQLGNILLSTILPLQLPNFVSCGRACPSHMTQNLVTVGAKLLTGEWFLFDPWSMDQADLVW